MNAASTHLHPSHGFQDHDVITLAYAQALGIPYSDVDALTHRFAHQTYLAHTADDTTAARLAGIPLEDFLSERSSLIVVDMMPRIITGTVEGITGHFYYQRPPEGWYRPGKHIP